ncbi:hypothetical protein D3C75_1301490 [compost metagenome]
MVLDEGGKHFNLVRIEAAVARHNQHDLLAAQIGLVDISPERGVGRNIQVGENKYTRSAGPKSMGSTLNCGGAPDVASDIALPWP